MNDSGVKTRIVPSTKRMALTVVPGASSSDSPSSAARCSYLASAGPPCSSSPSASAASRKLSFQTAPTRSAKTVGAICESCS